ncbi:MAG: hypothetical protein GY817_01280 [bacterium]|nr:hypothetical protein [bacterium]
MSDEKRGQDRYRVMDVSVIHTEDKKDTKSNDVMIQDMSSQTVRINPAKDFSFSDNMILELKIDKDKVLNIPLSIDKTRHSKDGTDYIFHFNELDSKYTNHVQEYLSAFEKIEEWKEPVQEHRNNKSNRIPIDLSINVQDDQEYLGRILNLSTTGLAFKLGGVLKVDSLYNLKVNISKKSSTINIKVQISRKDETIDNEGMILYGAEIIDIEEEDKILLGRILDKAENGYYRIPNDRHLMDAVDIPEARREWLNEKIKKKGIFKHITNYSIIPESIKGNIENFIGTTQMPIGVAGPVKVNGEHAQGIYYVPFATTEGSLVATYQRGMLAITKAGGANVVISKSVLDVSPVFKFDDVFQAKFFTQWVAENFFYIKQEAEKTTKHGKLLSIKPYQLGINVILNFQYNTGDAMGLNMVNIASDAACKYIQTKIKTNGYYLRSNFSSDKKASFFNLINSYGKEVQVEVTLSKKILRKYLGTTADKFYDLFHLGIYGSIHAGMVGANCHFANGLAAMFIACGQDVAQIVNASIGMSICNKTADEGVQFMLKIPNLIIGTVGGGTNIGTNRECLALMDCEGSGNVNRLAEIMAASLLAGEISISAALSANTFIQAHIDKRDLISKELS